MNEIRPTTAELAVAIKAYMAILRPRFISTSGGSAIYKNIRLGSHQRLLAGYALMDLIPAC